MPRWIGVARDATRSMAAFWLSCNSLMKSMDILSILNTFRFSGGKPHTIKDVHAVKDEHLCWDEYIMDP